MNVTRSRIVHHALTLIIALDIIVCKRRFYPHPVAVGANSTMPRSKVYFILALLAVLVGTLAFVVNPPKSKREPPKFSQSKFDAYQKQKERAIQSSRQGLEMEREKREKLKQDLIRQGRKVDDNHLPGMLDDNSGWYTRRESGKAGIDKLANDRIE